MTSELAGCVVDGARVSYRFAGSGPALVAVNTYRYPRAGLPEPREGALLRRLRDRWQVFQIDPIGFGWSDRPALHPTLPIATQICAVLDRHAVDRFLVWGGSQRGAMAMTVARETPRVAGLIASSFGWIDRPRESRERTLACMDRLALGTPASRAFWHDFYRFEWVTELAALHCPRLLYWGADDPAHARHLRRAGGLRVLRGVDFMEFDDAGHDVPLEVALPRVLEWVDRRVGASW